MERLTTTHRGPNPVYQVFRESFLRFYTDDSLTIAASIAYYSVLSIFPLLLLLLGISGIYIRHHQLEGKLAFVLEPILPMKPDFLLQNLVEISHAYGRVGFASFLLLLWSSAGVFLPVERALNRAWGVQVERSWWRRRLLALEMALLFALLILVSAGLVGASLYVRSLLPLWISRGPAGMATTASHLLISLATFGMTLGMFVVLFHRLLHQSKGLGQILPGALVTAFLWQTARSVFTFFLPHFNYQHVYGSIGALVALMTWAYVSSAVMLFGASISGTLDQSLRESRRRARQ